MFSRAALGMRTIPETGRPRKQHNPQDGRGGHRGVAGYGRKRRVTYGCICGVPNVGLTCPQPVDKSAPHSLLLGTRNASLYVNISVSYRPLTVADCHGECFTSAQTTTCSVCTSHPPQFSQNTGQIRVLCRALVLLGRFTTVTSPVRGATAPCLRSGAAVS